VTSILSEGSRVNMHPNGPRRNVASTEFATVNSAPVIGKFYQVEGWFFALLRNRIPVTQRESLAD
jgi:hypothetical protein